MTKRITSTTKSEPWLPFDKLSAETGIPLWRLKRWAYAGRLPASRPDSDGNGHGRLYGRVSDVNAVMEAAVENRS